MILLLMNSPSGNASSDHECDVDLLFEVIVPWSPVCLPGLELRGDKVTEDRTALGYSGGGARARVAPHSLVAQRLSTPMHDFCVN